MTTPASGVSSSADTRAPVLPDEPVISADTEITGLLLKRLREARGIAIADISARTKVGASHLRAIEDERWEVMPAEVYLRGFVVELARYLRLDPAHVAQAYVARARRHRVPREA